MMPTPWLRLLVAFFSVAAVDRLALAICGHTSRSALHAPSAASTGAQQLPQKRIPQPNRQGQ
jgi:hypothetical protein